MSSIENIYELGGVLTIPLFIVSVLTATIILERSFYWILHKKDAAKRGLLTLETMITIAPIIGILGTIVGIMDAFSSLQIVGKEGLDLLSRGISKALITTAFGLTVAIIGQIFLNLFHFMAERQDCEAKQ